MKKHLAALITSAFAMGAFAANAPPAAPAAVKVAQASHGKASLKKKHHRAKKAAHASSVTKAGK